MHATSEKDDRKRGEEEHFRRRPGWGWRHPRLKATLAFLTLLFAVHLLFLLHFLLSRHSTPVPTPLSASPLSLMQGRG
ncbi:MAG: hypothetical protein D6795_12065 [Deltaproteobacteria bacterium]|nr:MAG: hypothetical protein D6795_12065 [Deltaproteobacteria bacterium]